MDGSEAHAKAIAKSMSRSAWITAYSLISEFADAASWEPQQVPGTWVTPDGFLLELDEVVNITGSLRTDVLLHIDVPRPDIPQLAVIYTEPEQFVRDTLFLIEMLYALGK